MPEPEEISPENLEAARDAYLAGLVDKIPVDQSKAEVEWGDEIYLDILPYMYGVAVEAYHYKNSYARIGEEMYGEGLDEEILGMKVGDSREITTTLGSQYGVFAGTEATFKVTVTKIVRFAKPGWNEEFICGYMGFDSLDACDEMLKESLIKPVEVSDEEITNTLLDEALRETAYYDVPTEDYYIFWNRCYNIIYDQLAKTGMSPEESYITQGKNLTVFYSTMDDIVAEKLRDCRFYAAVAKKENISLTAEELIPVIRDYMNMLGCTTFEELMRSVSLQTIADAAIESKINRIIRDTAVIEP